MVQFDPQMVAQMLMQPIQRASENLGGAPFGIGADAGGSFFVDPEVAARTGYGTAVTGTSFFPGAGIVDAAGGAVDITGQPLPSFSENIREGQFTDAGLQALGVAGDIATIAAPLTGGATALLGAMMKAPGAARKVTKATDVARSTEIRNLPNRVLHGTLVDNVDSIKKLGIVPDIGENVSFSYGEYEDLLKPFSFFSGTDDIDRSLSAIKNQVGIKLGKQASEVTDADIVKHGALVVSRVEDTGSIFRVNEGGDMTALADEKAYFEAPVSGETDDIVSSETVKPSGILTGQKLKQFLENRKLIESTDVASDVAGIAKVEPPKSDTDSLIVQHNINEVSLKRSEELGGLPVPSMAISKVNEPLTSFGDITLVGPKDLAKPGANNPVYRADAYTTRRPRTEVFPNDELENFVSERIVKPFDNLEAKGASFDASGVAEAIYRGEEGTYSSIPLRAAYLKEKGQLPEFTDKFELNKYIRSEFRETEDYYNWIESLRQDALNVGGTADEKIFLGFTPSGNRRYAPATLENIVKEMKKNKGAGQEGSFLSMGSLRAKLTPKLKTQKEISKSRNKIVSKEEFEKAKDEASETFGQFLNDIQNVVPEKTDYRTVEELFEDIVLGDLGKYEYSKPFEPLITEKMMQQGKKVRDLLVDMPTEYFEIKPQRAVNLSEFKGAIVPDNALESSIKALKNSGIEKIYKYKNEAERKALFKKFPELMFSAGGFGLGLSATSQMMQGEMSD